MEYIYKYPRTRHLEGSGLQADDDPVTAPWSELAGRYLVIEEKIDGANCGVSFRADGQLQLQSRGHYLTGGPRERQFALFKSWAYRYYTELWDMLGSRYILYGEWCYSKHSIFYNDLPHYFMAFDMLDTTTGTFLATERRAAMLRIAPCIASVNVLHTGTVASLAALQAFVGPSHFITAKQREALEAAAQEVGLDPALVVAESDLRGMMEGLYIKTEAEGRVTGRFKYVRRGFLQTVLDSGSHWQERPLIPNRLRAGVELW